MIKDLIRENNYEKHVWKYDNCSMDFTGLMKKPEVGTLRDEGSMYRMCDVRRAPLALLGKVVK